MLYMEKGESLEIQFPYYSTLYPPTFHYWNNSKSTMNDFQVENYIGTSKLAQSEWKKALTTVTTLFFHKVASKQF